MDIAAVIVIAAVAAIFIIILFHHAIRIKFERQFEEWRNEQIIEWQNLPPV